MRGASRVLLLAATVAAQHYEALPSIEYHLTLRRAGDQPLLIAYLNESATEFEQDEEEFELAAEGFHCLPANGTYAMLAGTEGRAVFIAREDNVSQPSLSLFASGKRVAHYDGEWVEQSLLEWVYWTLAGVRFVQSVDEVVSTLGPDEKAAVRRIAACAIARAWGGSVGLFDDCAHPLQVAVVDKLCGEESSEFTRALLAHWQKFGFFMKAAISTNASIAPELELDLGASRGVAVVGSRGPGMEGATVNAFPRRTLGFTADELQPWMSGLVGTAQPEQPKREKPRRRRRARAAPDEL